MNFRPSIDKFLRSRWTVVISALTLILSLGLLGYEDPRQINGWPPLGVSLRLPGWHMQARTTRYAFSFYCQRNSTSKSAAIAFGNSAYLLNPSYHHGAHLEAVGFGFAFLPTTYNGGDYFVFPHIAIGIPFWFTATACGFVLMYAFYHRFHHRNHTGAISEHRSQ